MFVVKSIHIQIINQDMDLSIGITTILIARIYMYVLLQVYVASHRWRFDSFTSAGARTGICRFVKIFFKVPVAFQT